MPEGKLREKGKKESQVFASMADNPRHVFSAPSLLACVTRQVPGLMLLWLECIPKLTGETYALGPSKSRIDLALNLFGVDLSTAGLPAS